MLNLNAKGFFLMGLLSILAFSVSGLTVSVAGHSYVFHCESDELMCNQTLGEFYELKLVDEEHLDDRTDRKGLKSEILAERPEQPESKNNISANYSVEDFQKNNYEENGSYWPDEKTLTSAAVLNSTWPDVPVNITKESEELHDKEVSLADNSHHFYPKKNFSTTDVDGNLGCWSLEKTETGDFYKIEWHQTLEPWYCIELGQKASGSKTVLNVNPLTWF